jgi:hypothetical protein
VYFEILCTRPRIGSWLLRAVLFSRWSHSAVFDADTGLVYEATAWHGVRRRPVEDFFADYPARELREIRVAPPLVLAARQWLDQQLGKGYDWTAIAGFFVRYWTGAHWHDPSDWFCSEMSEAFRSRYSTPRFRAEAWRVTPAHQDMAE